MQVPPQRSSRPAVQLSKANEYRLKGVCCFSVSSCAKAISWFYMGLAVLFLLQHFYHRIFSDYYFTQVSPVIFQIVWAGCLILGVYSKNAKIIYHVYLLFAFHVFQVHVMIALMLLLGELHIEVYDITPHPRLALFLGYLMSLGVHSFFAFVYYSLYLDSRSPIRPPPYEIA